MFVQYFPSFWNWLVSFFFIFKSSYLFGFNPPSDMFSFSLWLLCFPDHPWWEEVQSSDGSNLGRCIHRIWGSSFLAFSAPGVSAHLPAVWWPWIWSSGSSGQRSAVWHPVALRGYHCPGPKSSSATRDSILSHRVRTQSHKTAQPSSRCRRPGVGPQLTHNFCLTLLQIRGVYDPPPFWMQ